MRTNHEINAHVGARIKLRRTMLGLSQTQLAERLGLTFQQIQKYERGTNNVAVARLLQLAQVLDVPVSFFLDGLEGYSSDGFLDRLVATNEKREFLELSRAFSSIKSATTRLHLRQLAAAIGAEAQT